MGVSMCSQVCNREKHTINDFELTEEWDNPDEMGTNDENEVLNLPMMNKSISMPADLRRVLGNVPKVKRSRSGQLPTVSRSLPQGGMKDWHRLSVYDREGEENARRYSRRVSDDTLKHLNHTVRIAGSIVEKGNDINKELARQDGVLLRAENDGLMTEYETDQANEALKGMSSLKGKVSSVIRRKKPKVKVNPVRNVQMNFMDGEVSLCAFSRMGNCNSSNSTSSIPSQKTTEDTHQKQISKGIGTLHEVLDVITIQQMDAAWALDRNEERLSVFEKQLITTHEKINCQSQMIKKIMGKS